MAGIGRSGADGDGLRVLTVKFDSSRIEETQGS